jgi:hypothetical protein
MRYSSTKSIAATLALAFAALALLFLLDRGDGHHETQMTRVGGRMNECTCSQRLDR